MSKPVHTGLSGDLSSRPIPAHIARLPVLGRLGPPGCQGDQGGLCEIDGQVQPSVGADQAKLVPGWILENPRREFTRLGDLQCCRTSGHHVVEHWLSMIYEQIEVHPGLGDLRLRHSLKGDQSEALVARWTLEGDIWAVSATGPSLISQELLPEAGNQIGVWAVDCHADLHECGPRVIFGECLQIHYPEMISV